MKALLKKSSLSLLFVLIVLIPVAIGVVTNVVTTEAIPPWLKPWLTWPTLLLLALFLVIATLLYEKFIKPADKPESLDEKRRERNRQAMLKLVDSHWVKGVLENSLHGAVLMELGLQERQEAVAHPLNMILQTGQQNRTLPVGTKIGDVFDDMGCNLLILGEPGAGKTTMLLELAVI